MVPEIIDQRPQQKYENESIQVIKSISSIIKDVINQEKDTQAKSDFDNIVQKIKNQVPKDVKLSTPQIDNSELLAKITETVGNILTDEEIESIVLLRNTTAATGNSQEEAGEPTSTTSIVEEEEDESISSAPATVSTSRVEEVGKTSSPESVTEEVSEVESSSTEQSGEDEQSVLGTTVRVSLGEVLVGNLSIVPSTTDRNKEINQSYEEPNKGIVRALIILKIYNQISLDSVTEGDGIVLNLTRSPEENEISDEIIPPSASEVNEGNKIIQDGNLFAETFNAGVIKAKVVEDLSYARSIRRSNVGVAAIISIVIGILASICFAIMILLALRRRRRYASAEAPSSSAYTNTSRYTPDTSESAISDMKPTYAEELSPNVSSSDLHNPEVVLQMDGHQTIIGSYEEFLDVPTGARPSIFQCLPVSPTMHTETVRRTVEMTDPELAFTPSSKH